jgi:hypothetical protein
MLLPLCFYGCRVRMDKHPDKQLCGMRYEYHSEALFVREIWKFRHLLPYAPEFMIKIIKTVENYV